MNTRSNSFGRSLLISTALFAACCAGCASGPKYSEYRAAIPIPSQGMGRIWFYRPSAMGAAVQPAVKLDNQVVGRAVPRGFFYADTQPGTHEVSATTEWKHQKSVTVETNSDSYVQLNIMLGLFVGHIIPEVVPEATATNRMRNLRWAGESNETCPAPARLQPKNSDGSPKAN